MQQVRDAKQLFFGELGYLHPKVLKEKYSLNETRLALLLGKNVRSVERYCSPSSADDLPESVLIHSWLLDFYLSHAKSF
jgi:hypothetical protein